MNHDIQSWINKQRVQGLTNEQIANQLKQQGWTDNQISQLFGGYSPSRQKNSLKKWIIIFVTVMVIIIIGVVTWVILNLEVSGTKVNIEVNPNILSVDKILSQFKEVGEPNCTGYATREKCVINLAKIEKNPRYCSKIVTGYDVDECYMAVAYALARSDVCKLNPSSSGRQACEAVATRDITKCNIDKVITKSVCYTYIAKATKNVDLCDDLKDSVATANQDWANYCYKEMAAAMNDVRICEKIKDDSLSGTDAWENANDYNFCQKAVEDG